MVSSMLNFSLGWPRNGSNPLIHMSLTTGSGVPSVASTGARIITLPFVLAMALLGAAACLAGPLASWLDISQRKLALPLRAPLGRLDTAALAPYRVIRRDILDPAVVESLGTNRYLSWVLEDESVEANDPLRMGHLLITYDTGGNNLVPHTPEVCWLGGGYQRAQPHENLDLEIGSPSGPDFTVPVRLCTFIKTALKNRARKSVAYTFYCNGRFVAMRDSVRILLNRPWSRYAYFSKVEVSFPRATREQTLRGVRKLFNRLLPLLIDQHWPDFESAERAARDATTTQQ